jgi:hypothetical protein
MMTRSGQTTFNMSVDPFATLSEVNPFENKTDIETSQEQAWTDFKQDDIPDFSFGDDEDLKTEANTGRPDSQINAFDHKTDTETFTGRRLDRFC